jgi:Winged helix-turn-helix
LRQLRRSQIEIFSDILAILNKSPQRVTRIMYVTNINCNIISRMLRIMNSAGYVIISKGRNSSSVKQQWSIGFPMFQIASRKGETRVILDIQYSIPDLPTSYTPIIQSTPTISPNSTSNQNLQPHQQTVKMLILHQRFQSLRP